MCAFLLGVIISQIFGSTFCGLKAVEEVDNQSYLLVVLVLSAPQNYLQRDTIRETWLNLRPDQLNGTEYRSEIIFVPRSLPNSHLEIESVERQGIHLAKYQKWLKADKPKSIKMANIKIKHLFAIGTQGLADDEIMGHINAEQKVFHDMLLLDDLHDSYKNLTLKLVKSLQKLHVTTPNMKYLLKCDDDSYVKLNLLAQDLVEYDSKLHEMKQKKQTLENLELYWGYFNGRANIKKSGQWAEANYHLCDRYLPYALGGGYVISKGLVTYIAEHGDNLNRYGSEDISMGTWLAPFRNIHKRHDVRFDTAYQPRKCKGYHIVLHKRTPLDIRQVFEGETCYSEVDYEVSKRPVEYFYDWSQSPMKCCDNYS